MSFISDAIQTAVHAGIDKLVSGAPGFIQNMVGGGDTEKKKGRKGARKGEEVEDAEKAEDAEDAEKAEEVEEAAVQMKPKPSTAPRKPKSSETSSPAVSAKLKSKSSSVNAAAAASGPASSPAAHINKHAFAKVSGVRVVGAELHFTLSNAHVSTANALRRIILSEIPTLVFRTFPH